MDILSQTVELKNLIEVSARILITSHISPDPDALASVLLMGQTLRRNFPDKQVSMALEEKPVGLEFMEGFGKVDFQPVWEAVQTQKPQLLILLDGNNYERCSREDGQKIREFILAAGIKTAIIDHHELPGRDEADIFINNKSAATVQDVYGLIKGAGLHMPESGATTAMVGFYADTGGFVYVKDGDQSRMFGFAEELVTAGADIEDIKYKLESYSESDMKVLGQLASNITHAKDYSYSFLSDDFITSSGLTSLKLQRPTNAFMNNYIRNIGGRRWGFIVYKNSLQGDNYYSVSFRSQGGSPDVASIATALGGGGHKPAAGAKFQAASVDDAINKVKTVIGQS